MDAHKGGCVGAVQCREPLSGEGPGVLWCDGHYSRALRRARLVRAFNALLPERFGPADAGERWEGYEE